MARSKPLRPEIGGRPKKDENVGQSNVSASKGGGANILPESVGMPKTTVESICTKNETFRFPCNPGEKEEIENNEERLNALEEQNRSFAFHNAEFEKPIYNIWKQQTKTAGSSHFGNSEVRWLDR